MNIEKNIVFGMYSDWRAAVTFTIQRSRTDMRSWLSGERMDVEADLRCRSANGAWLLGPVLCPEFLDAGYTLFVVNHRNGPRFHYPAAVRGRPSRGSLRPIQR